MRFEPYKNGYTNTNQFLKLTELQILSNLHIIYSMTTKLYDVLLDSDKIGVTELEKADALMGVVFGQIKFTAIESGYALFKTYCSANEVELYCDDVDKRLILTAHIPTLKVVNQNGVEIIGLATTIEGMDTDVFDVTIVGVPYPFYEEEFPHPIKAYHDLFNTSH